MGAPVPTQRTSRSRRWCGCRALPVPRCPYTGCRCLSASSVATRHYSNEIRHCSRCSRPSRFHLRWNTMPSPHDPCGCSPDSTFRVPRQSGDGYNAGGYLSASFFVSLVSMLFTVKYSSLRVCIFSQISCFSSRSLRWKNCLSFWYC